MAAGAANPVRLAGATGWFDRIASVEGLLLGWERVASRSPLAGSDGLYPAQFARQLDDHLAQVAAALRHGRYHPLPPRRFTVPKRHGGGVRRLALLAVADRVVQSAAVQLLTPAFEAVFEPSSHGYRPGRSVGSATAQIGALYRDGWRHVVEADIRDFFDSVPHPPLLALLARHFADPPLIRLFDQWLQLSAFPGRGLVQGAPISPLFANLYLDHVDEAVAAQEARIVRFADDFVVLTRTRARAERVLRDLQPLLATLGLALHPGKSGVSDFDHGFLFLGKRFLKSFVLDDSSEADLEAWEAAFAEALPEGSAAAAAPPVPLRRFRDVDFADPVALPTRPLEGLAEPPPAVDRADGLRPLSPRTRTLHLYGRGRTLAARDHGFTVEEAGREIWLCAPERIDRIDLGPAATVTDAALRFALERGVAVRFTDGHGRTRGTLDRPPRRGGERHLHQAAHVLDAGRRLALARAFVAGKIVNQRQVVLRWRNNHRPRAGGAGDGTAGDFASFAAAQIPGFDRLAAQAQQAADMPALLGLEGAAQKLFLRLFRKALRCWTMAPRARRPAPDAVNAVLNWLAHLLARDVEVALDRHGLHPGFAHLHAVSDDRDGLAFDLIEELRPPLVEAAALTLFNSNTLQPHHFWSATEGAGMRIDAEGSAKLIHGYEEWMVRRRLRHPDIDGETNWRGVIDAQVLRYVAHVEGGAPYVPYRVKA